jgi:hypothetical protein
MVQCKDCKYWATEDEEWYGCKTCEAAINGKSVQFFVSGDDDEDSLLTAPNFGCMVGVKKKEYGLCTCGHPEYDHAMEYGKGGVICRHVNKNNFYCACEDYKSEKE